MVVITKRKIKFKNRPIKAEIYNMSIKKSVILIIVYTYFLCGCSGFMGEEELALNTYIFNENLDPVLAENAQNILASKCLSCHFENSQSGYLNFPELINDGFITKGPADRSVLYKCINGECTTRDGFTTTNMAINGNLSPGEISIMNDFIDQLFIQIP